MTGLQQHLSHLESSDFIRLAQLEPELAYLFRHGLMRDAAYESMLRQDRRRLHLSVAQAIEQAFPRRSDEFAATLADHYLQAGEHQTALRYLHRAGDLAAASFANAEAETHYRAALDLNPDIETEARLLEALGETLDVQSRYVEAIPLWESGIDRCTTLGDLDGVARLYAALSRTLWSAGNSARALEVSEEGLRALPTDMHSTGYARLMLRYAGNLRFNHRSEEGLEPCQRAVEMADQLGDAGLKAEALVTQALLTPMLEEREQYLREAIDLALTAKALRTAYRACNNLGATLAYLGRLPEAHRVMVRAVELSERQGDVMAMLQSISNAATYASLIGEFGSAERLISLMQSLHRRVTPSSRTERMLRIPLSVFYNSLGDLAQEREVLRPLAQMVPALEFYEFENWIVLSALNDEQWQEAADRLESPEQPEISPAGETLALRHYLAAWLHRETGDLTSAREWIDRAQAIEIPPSRTDNSLVIRQVCAFQLAAEGRWNDAEREIEAIETSADYREMRAERAIFQFNRAKTIARWGQPGDRPRALAILNVARAEFAQMGAQGWVDRIDEWASQIDTARTP